MVPNGWKIEKLGDLCTINPKKPLKPNDDKVSFIAMNQLSESGKVILITTKKYDDVSKGFTSFMDNDVLVAKITPCFENGKGALVKNLMNGVGFGSTEFHVLRAKKNTCPEFIYYLTRTNELRAKGEMNMQGSAGHRRVTADYFNAYKVKTPPLQEQQKIAKILSTWDKAISTTEALIDNSKQQKKALMQQLLTGKKRFAGFEGEWEEVKLGELFKERVETGVNNLPLISITSLAGVIDRNDVGRKDTSNSDKSKYRRICHNDIGYNTMRMWQGVSGLSNMEGIVSPAYTIVIPQKGANPTFASYLFKLPDLIHIFRRNSQGLVSDTWNLKYPHFAKIKWLFPLENEQQKIALVLINADKEIKLLEKQLIDLKQEKKALMQQLLTGKKRVRVN